MSVDRFEQMGPWWLADPSPEIRVEVVRQMRNRWMSGFDELAVRADGPLGSPIAVTIPSAVTNVAWTDRAWSIRSVQGAVPRQSPLHPANTQPGSGVAVNVMVAPVSIEALQVKSGQSMASESAVGAGPLTSPSPITSVIVS